MTHEPGEGPRKPDAKERARKVLEDPKHHKPKGSPEDMATVDGEIEPKEVPTDD